MLVATPGQTTAYALHNNNSGNTTTTANNIPTATAVSSAATSTSCSVVTASKKQATLNNSSSMGTPKSVNNNSHIHNNTSAISATAITANNHNNFHAPPNKKELNNLSRNPSITASSIDKNSQQQHSFKNTDISRPSSFLSALKDSVQKALVTTASSLPRSGSNQNATATTLNTSNTTSNNTSTKPIIASASSSSSLSVATTKNSSNTIIATAASSSSASTILPLPVARKKFVQAIATQPKLHTIPPTILHRYPEERQKTSSTDSLQKEMCHFKPIRTAPTTPWKSGSKSRGSSLRFPKANLATTKSEFILKSNCDVNNRKKRQQPKVMETDQEKLGVAGKTGGAGKGGDGDDNDEQENKQYFETYKPKPSPLYSPSSLVTPNHQSAFVCLVTNLMNMQPTKSVATPSAKGNGNGKGLQKSKSTRVVGRQKEGGTTAKAANITEPVKELFVRTKKFKSPLPPQPLPAKKADAGTNVTRSQRSIGKSVSTFFGESQKMAKTNELSTKLTKSKSRRKLKGAKSIIMDDVQFSEAEYLVKPTVDTAAKDNVIKPTTSQRNTRKRKAKPESSGASNAASAPKRRATTTSTLLNIQPSTTQRTSIASARKNVSLSAESNSSRALSKHAEVHLNTTRLQNSNQRYNIRFSPPLTRSRLKKMQQSEQHSPKGSTATSSAIE